MVKRKVSTNGDANTKSSKKVKKVSETVAEINGTTKLDMLSSSKLLSSMFKPTLTSEFFSTYWEKKPFYLKREDTDFYGDLFTLDSFKDMLKEHELMFETDVNVCRYVDNEKELLNGEGRITVANMQSLMKDKKATFQIHQPQRFFDGLWNVIEKLETHFGSLVGTNVYITPPGAQGLAPHCDDVEIIVLQLEGEKTWKLYKPMVELSRDYTQDLQEADIGEPTMEITLQPGDLLYFPRGTIHQAKTASDTHSTHISISTYQQNTWGDFMNHAVTQAIENALEDNVSIRSGLPINYLSFLGTSKNFSKYIEIEEGKEKKALPSNEKDKQVTEFKETVKKHLASLVDHIDVNTAADAMCSDFMMNRMPPFGHVVTEDDEEDRKVPTLDDQVKIKFPDHVRVVYSEAEDENADVSQLEEGDSETEEDEEKPASKVTKKVDEKKKGKSKAVSDAEDDDEDDEDVNGLDEEPCIRILHSLNNDREAHMCGDSFENEGVGILKLPLHFGPAAIALLEAKDFVPVKDFLLDEDEDKICLVTTLFADDLLEIK